jgi:cold-inducible RNA-binding protein
LTKKVYVGNLSFNATEQQVQDLFAEFGKVESVAMINDRDSGRFRGFCFVEMEDSAANAAINALNGKSVDDRELQVNEARPREERSGGGGNRSGGSSNRRNSYGSNNRW